MIKNHFLLFYFLLISIGCYCQDRTIDTLLQKRNTDSLPGKVKTFYSPGHKDIALELQQLVSGAVLYYEKKYQTIFDIQLIVLDSSQWFREIIPYGFVFYDQTHWLVLNTGMSYKDFKSIYGFNGISSSLDSSFSENHITADEVIYDRLKFLSLHELGHYFVYKLSSAQAPDTWTNEFVATYFANEYVTQFEPGIKKGFDIFCRTILRCYPAEYRSLGQFDSLYVKMKIGNFAWYHSRFYIFADKLYPCAGNSYINTFQTNFPKKEGLIYTPETINKLIEANCSSLFYKWNSTY
jgi:hypothetical protein